MTQTEAEMVLKTYHQIKKYRKGVKPKTVEAFWKLAHEAKRKGITGTRLEFFLAQVLADTKGLVDGIDLKNPSAYFDKCLAKWEQKDLNKEADYKNFGEVIRKYGGANKSIMTRITWLARLTTFLYLLKP